MDKVTLIATVFVCLFGSGGVVLWLLNRVAKRNDEHSCYGRDIKEIKNTILRVQDGLVMALEKAKDKGLNNIHFISADARNLKDFFKESQVDRIYLNFSDPWPKNKKEKMRITHIDFLDIYKYILKDKGQIHQKTDNVPLFDYSINAFKTLGFGLSQITYDLHSDGFEGNIMTEYERRFVKEGKRICRLVAENHK